MRRRWVSSLPSLMLLSLCLACDIPERPKTTTISNPPAFRPSSPKDVKTPEQALGAIITVCRDALHLPVVNPVHLSRLQEYSLLRLLRIWMVNTTL